MRVLPECCFRGSQVAGLIAVACFGLFARENRVFGGARGLGWKCGSVGRHRYEFAGADPAN